MMNEEELAAFYLPAGRGVGLGRRPEDGEKVAAVCSVAACREDDRRNNPSRCRNTRCHRNRRLHSHLRRSPGALS